MIIAIQIFRATNVETKGIPVVDTLKDTKYF